MKAKAAVGVVLLGLLGASVAFAAPPPGKGHYISTSGVTTTQPQGKKPPTTGPGCRPAIAVILNGTLTANGSAAPAALTVTVSGGNRFAKAYRSGPQPVSVATTTSTRVSRQGGNSLTALKTGDRVNIQARACKADLAHDATPALTAVRVSAHPASS